MNDDELKQAEERRRIAVQCDWHGPIYPYSTGKVGNQQICRDASILADASLARLAADEVDRAEREKLIDDGYVDTLSTRQITADGIVWVLGIADVGGTVVLFRKHAGPRLYAVCLGGTKLSMTGNVGQLLDLLRALGIQVKP
jgi:hypothetical protein